ncbi:hypothetical protein [Candidatus Nitrotoga sp. 1052]|uniref:hypothetical protein n=1 Tax=Candidatus Nitrotoga sp. 1052 TaxID=2886964 RepID=UPI001EF48DFE|nr:hypothetical protein [Candidatus Nitrotoga sp. 1052]CAH1086144.1 conserved exported hypothetical protein [Candidatus Nitrotoga sp. 1052]
MMLKRLPVIAVLVVTCLLGAPLQASAMAIANSTLDFKNLSVTPASGEILLDGSWFLETFAHADNSLGQIDEHFTPGSSPDTVSASAAVTWASATGTASAPNDPPDLVVTGLAESDVNLPGSGAAAAFGKSRSTLFNTFTLSGGGSSVDVQFAIDISGLLNVMTDAFGLFAQTETVFTLEVDGTPILFHNDLLSIGPSDSDTRSFSTHLSNTVTLAAFDLDGLPLSHSLLLEAETDPRGMVVPEPPVGLLLITGLAALAAARRRPVLVRLEA